LLEQFVYHWGMGSKAGWVRQEGHKTIFTTNDAPDFLGFLVK